MTAIEETTRIRIDAPSGDAALLLEKRLRHLHPATVGRGDEWSVHIADAADELDEIEAAVAHWLRDVGAASTEIRVDGTRLTVRPRTIHMEAPLGYDEDGRVLEHEP